MTYEVREPGGADIARNPPLFGETELDLSHPAYLQYQNDCRRLRRKAEQNAWTLADVQPLLGVDAASYADLPEAKRQSFLFMAAHRLQAEFRVAQKLGPFLAAVPKEDLETQIMLALQQYEEYKHTEGQRLFYHDVLGISDFSQMQRVAEENTDFISQALFDGHERYLSRLTDQPTQHNLTANFFAYHGLAEGVIAEVFAKHTYDSIDQYGDFPGFKAGHEKVCQDEARHVAFGMAYCRLQYALEPEAATAAIMEPAIEFRQAIDGLLQFAEANGMEQLALDGYGKTPREIHAAVNEMFLLRLRRIHPELERSLMEESK
jgi:ribonucleoside-diphosphate reductase beta chain